MKKIAIAYIPVLHKGYIDFLQAIAAQGVIDLYLVADDVLEAHEELDYLNRKDRLRAVPTEGMLVALQTQTALKVHLLDQAAIAALQTEVLEIVTPNEEIGRIVIEAYFSTAKVTYENIFVRRHKDNVGEDKLPEASSSIQLSDFQRRVFKAVHAEAARSFDWWRQVAAALVKDNEVVLIAHNEHMPEEQISNILGDARGLFSQGVHINYVTSAHAEITVIAEAAKRGITTEGAELYVTDFPCPYCARAIAKSGIKKVYFEKGYAVLDGDEFLKEEGVEVIQVSAD